MIYLITFILITYLIELYIKKVNNTLNMSDKELIHRYFKLNEVKK